eukprot:3764103-Ditylum_brightwellii.AAC.1
MRRNNQRKQEGRRQSALLGLHTIKPTRHARLQPHYCMGGGKDACIAVMRRVGSVLNHLGEQEEARKTHPPTDTTLGAWAGKLFCIDKGLG